MKKTLILGAFALLSAGQAGALDARVTKQLDALAPAERREQRCDIEALARIRKGGDYKPDKVIAYSFGETIGSGDSIAAPGAVFRAKGDWYRLNYKCQTADEGMKIVSFDFKIGEKVPKEQWEKHYLYE